MKQLNGLKDAMIENLEGLIERDGKIEVILQKAESLSSYSKTYRSRVRLTLYEYLINNKQYRLVI